MVTIRKAYADTSIGQIHYRYAGEGEKLLLLHNSPSCSEVYEPLMKLLAPSLSLVALDTPGFGMSPFPPNRYTIPGYARIVFEVLDDLKVAKTNVLGHHTGSAIACELAAAYPYRVNKLVLSGPPLADAAEGKRRVAAVPHVTLEEDGSHLLVHWNHLTRTLSEQHQPMDLEGMHREVAWRIKAGPRWTDAAAAVFTYNMASRLPLIQAPTLVMSGEKETFLRSVLETVKKQVKDARMHVFAGAGTLYFLQQTEEAARVIHGFLSPDS